MSNRTAKPRQQLDLDDQLKTASQLVIRARIFYDIWWFYEGADTRSAIVSAMQDYSEFVRFDSHAHFVAFIVHASALFDAKRKDVISLPRLVLRYKKAGTVDADVIKEARALLAQVDGTVESVATLRHNLFAHRSAFVSYAEAFKLAAVTANHLAKLMDVGLAVANYMLRTRGFNEEVFAPLPFEDARKMLQALERGAKR